MSTTEIGVYEVPQEHRDFPDGIRQVVHRVVEAVQVVGGYGYEGTDEIQRVVIAGPMSR